MTARDAEGNPFQPVSPASETRHTFPAWEHRPAEPAWFRCAGDHWELSQLTDHGTDEVILDAATWRALARFILDNVEDGA